MKLVFILLGLCQVGFSAQEIIDLGRIQIQGKMRGPEVQLIDSNQMGHEATEKMIDFQLKNMEKELLKHEPPK